MIAELIRLVENGYNIDTAVGAQLDVLGKYIGVDRTVYGVTFDRDYFFYILYAESPPLANKVGYSEYGVAPVGQYRTYQESNQSIYSMNDSEYRQALKLKIVENKSTASLAFADANILDFFNGKAILTDYEDMRISYIFEESIRLTVEIALSQGLILKPTGVTLLTGFTPYIDKIFGFKKYTFTAPSFIIGFKKYGVAKTGGWLKYG
jgi:hypothetical protein